MAKAFRHVGIVVSDLGSALTLYQDFLGCELICKYSNLEGEYESKLVGLKNVCMQVAILRTQDNNRIELLEYTSHPGKKRDPVCSNDIGASHFALTVEDLQALYDIHTKFDVRFLTHPLISPDGFVKVAYTVFMEECIVELVEVLDPRATYSGGNVDKVK